MQTKPLTRKIAGRTFSVDVSVTESEDGPTVNLRDAADAELAIATALALEGPVHGEAFKFMRKAMGMPATELGELLGVAAETISRWETGAREVDRGAWLALGSLVLERKGMPAAAHVRMERLAQGFDGGKVTSVAEVTRRLLESLPQLQQLAVAGHAASTETAETLLRTLQGAEGFRPGRR
jgi:DNA-binding transcriptional regulator YiaG